jgi:hypothetical protein
MSSTFGPRSLLDLSAEIRIGIYKYLLYANGSVNTHRSILGNSRGEVPVNLVFRFCGLKKVPTENLRACTQIKAEAELLLYQYPKNFPVGRSSPANTLPGSLWMEDDMRKPAAVLPSEIRCLSDDHPTLRRRPLARLGGRVR